MIKFPQLKSNKTVNRILIALGFIYLLGIGFVDGFGSKVNMCCDNEKGCLNIFYICDKEIQPDFFNRFTDCQLIEKQGYCNKGNGLCDKKELQYKECVGDTYSVLYKNASLFILLIVGGIILNILITTKRD